MSKAAQADAMHKDGKTYDEIARLLGIRSREAVAGMLYRFRRRQRIAVKPRETVGKVAACRPAVKVDGWIDGGCRYIWGDTRDGTAEFCGDSRHEHTAWCEKHYHVVYNTGARKRPVWVGSGSR